MFTYCYSVCIICDWIYENRSKSHKNWNPFYCLTLKLHSSTPRHTKHMAKDGQVCFHRRLFANPVKPQRCTTEPVRPLDGINKDVGGAKLLLMTTSVYPVDCACICPLLKTQHHCLCPNGRCNPSSASHPPPYTRYSWYYSRCEKSYSKSSSVS